MVNQLRRNVFNLDLKTEIYRSSTDLEPEKSWTVKSYTKSFIRHFPISHNTPCFPPPPPKKKKICISSVFNFSWDGCNTQKKVMQFFLGGGGGGGANKMNYGRCASGRGPQPLASGEAGCTCSWERFFFQPRLFIVRTWTRKGNHPRNEGTWGGRRRWR